MFDFTAIFKAITAALDVWRQERALRNSPAQIKNELDKSAQERRDRMNAAAAVLKNPNSTQEQKDAALQVIRLAHS